MFVIRPIRLNDLDILEEFAYATGLGMLSLPRDRDLLKQNIECSLKSFRKNISRPQDENYLFVLEDTLTGTVGGTTGIKAKTGFRDPLYFFRVSTYHQQSEKLPIPKELRVLHPIAISQGPSELCSLYLKHEWRNKGLGILLSLSRFLFIAGNQHRFDKAIMAVLRGFISKAQKSSPFWESLGRHFLNLDLEQVYTLLLKGRTFIPNFLPRHSIYACLLSKQAQYVIGKPHTTTRPALKILKKEGFQYTEDIDILEAGPVIASQTAEIRTVKNSIVAPIEEITDSPIASRPHVICNNRLDFRACCCTLHVTRKKGIILTKEVAETLEVDVGDTVRYATTHHRQKKI